MEQNKQIRNSIIFLKSKDYQENILHKYNKNKNSISHVTLVPLLLLKQ